ncbi:MAG: hypothetical protein QM780_00930 [Hyphomicrobium sp.]|uniref:hypothetical protein n=1 Tax=Hyphomicrobium sp. TaxID=82 RepID=UPI0039E3CC3F
MTERAILTIRRGALHLTREAYERFFKDLDNVVLLRDGNDLVVLPVRHRAAGGYVIKIRTGAGDRAVVASDFFRDNGIEDSVEMTLPAAWDDDRAALVVRHVFADN